MKDIAEIPSSYTNGSECSETCYKEKNAFCGGYERLAVFEVGKWFSANICVTNN
jgi:hypothetical protein